MGVAFHELTVANGQTTSSAAAVAGQKLVGISVGTVTATTCTFQVSHRVPKSPKGEGETAVWRTLRDADSVLVTVDITDDSFHAVLSDTFAGLEQIRVVAGTAAGAGDETWTLICRPDA